MNRYVRTALVAATVPVSAWFAGFDFNHRGWDAFVVFYLTLVVALASLVWRSTPDRSRR